MKVIDTNNKKAFKPDNHFGNLTVVDVLGPENSDHLTIQVSFGPVGSGSDMHSHEKSEQLFFILSGRLTMIGGDGEKEILSSGMAAYLSPKESHATLNEGEEGVVALVITSPHLR
ncbi:MAG: hypothetical protein A2X25_09350 [Chloroflexi bacterium GWB2_49_20]|nr:MAG: hypothetical protein A2X25_09350 [Chloroflexi bacterium GWB2_49_20]OGN79368.1 MAG: hypothetical protein A2X26_04675 [Chloroflexi bacterium GWC2_49_37]OGN82862.1 MAG: hypothetical protein A2X27_08020 [Chloroflexi bacterium GWD2_49_16]HCC78513.1 hypothetical protein [Anaerolineae bacterium]HCM97338.1 hypothetical protein [Anaerolineae bacterium]